MKKLKYLFSILIVLIFVELAHAQFNPQFSFLQTTLSYHNPAYVGYNQGICATALNRNQWVGFEGAPQTTVFLLNSPIKVIGIPGGIGISLYDDKAGLSHNFNLKAQYSYHTFLGSGQLGIGGGIGLVNLSYSGEWIAPESAAGDASIPSTGENRMALDAQLGVYYIKNNLKIAFSSDHINQANINFIDKNPPYLARHYYLYSSYMFDLSALSINIQPELLIVSDGASIQVNTNIIADYNNKFFGGFSYKIGDIAALAGIRLLDGIEIGITYGIASNKISKFSSEVYFKYCFDFQKDKKPSNYKSVRFL